METGMMEVVHKDGALDASSRHFEAGPIKLLERISRQHYERYSAIIARYAQSPFDHTSALETLKRHDDPLADCLRAYIMFSQGMSTHGGSVQPALDEMERSARKGLPGAIATVFGMCVGGWHRPPGISMDELGRLSYQLATSTGDVSPRARDLLLGKADHPWRPGFSVDEALLGSEACISFSRTCDLRMGTAFVDPESSVTFGRYHHALSMIAYSAGEAGEMVAIDSGFNVMFGGSKAFLVDLFSGMNFLVDPVEAKRQLERYSRTSKPEADDMGGFGRLRIGVAEVDGDGIPDGDLSSCRDFMQQLGLLSSNDGRYEIRRDDRFQLAKPFESHADSIRYFDGRSSLYFTVHRGRLKETLERLVSVETKLRSILFYGVTVDRV